MTGQEGSRRPGVLAATALLGVAAILVWLTVAGLSSTVAIDLASHRIQGGKRLGIVHRLHLPPPWWPGGIDVELTEDGRPLGPRVEDREAVLATGGGAFAVAVQRSAGARAGATLYVSSSDGSRPATNGRRYSLRFPRRQLPATHLLLLTAWCLLAAAVLRWWRAPPRPWSAGAAAWSVAVAGGLYTLFALQVWLPAPNGVWLLAVAAATAPPALARLLSGRWRLPPWLPWLAGFLGWGLASGLVASPGGGHYASPAAVLAFLAVTAGGFLAYLGLAGVGAGDGHSSSAAPLLAGTVFVFAVLSSLARDAGIDTAGLLAPLGSGARPARGGVNLWTTKFLAHWILVLTWCTLAVLRRPAEGRPRTGRTRVALGVVALSALAVWSNGSKAAALAWALSGLVATAALRWPVAVRRLLITVLVVGVLTAPALAAVPWAVQRHLPPGTGNGVVSDVEVRSGIWEYSRRLILQRPVAGWGFGAGASLPGRESTIAEALDVEAPRGSRLAQHPVFAGGHPHNAALLTWLDLGAVGAVLLAGLGLAVGRSIAAVQARSATHAALLGLLTATACLLAFNYPAWTPEVASLLWMSAVLASVALPAPAADRRWWLGSSIAAGLCVLLGCTALLLLR